MTCSIFIRSFDADFQWLSYCLRSIHKFANDFHEIVIAIPEGQKLDHLTQEKVVYVKEGKDDYVQQQSDKLNADLYCEGEYVWNIDSDTIVTQPIYAWDSIKGASAFTMNDKALWLMTPIENVLSNDPNTYAWKRSMTKFSGVEPQFEYMRRIGQMIPKWAYGCFREFCVRKHGKTFEEWAQEQNREVSEFNLIGQFLHLNFPNFIHFHDTTYGVPELVVKQFWSRGSLTDEIKADMEVILK